MHTSSLLLLLLTLSFSSWMSEGMVVGPVSIMENGQKVTRYAVASAGGSTARTNGSAIFLTHNAQVQIASSAAGSYAPNIFQEYKLAGKTLSFTTDLSRISCSCNSALYLVSMPGIGSNGQPTPSNSNNYYCDANDITGSWCWEMDVMEANKYVTQVTPHQCNAPAGKFITWCDRGGCATNSHDVNGNGMCPNSGCTINTSQPFRYSVSFGNTIDVKLTQNGRTFAFQSCNNGGYVSSMQQPLEYGMTLVMSYWGNSYNTMSWLDGKTGCQGNCDTGGVAIFSDIEIS